MKQTKFNWECPHCGKRNITALAFQFDIPKTYTAQWDCGKCGKWADFQFSFYIKAGKPPQD